MFSGNGEVEALFFPMNVYLSCLYSWYHFSFDMLSSSELSSCSTGGFLEVAGAGVMSTKPVPHF